MSDFNGLIAEVKSQVDIVNVCEQHGISLTQNGYRAKGLCPFHQEKTPSFIVDENTQTYHCFGCGESGDVLSFIQKITNTDFIDALKIAGNSSTVDVDKRLAEIYNNENVDIVDFVSLRSCVAKAAEFYSESFKELKETHEAKKMISERMFNIEDIGDSEYFGYADSKPRSLTDFLLSQGFNEETIVDAGLARKVEKNGKTMVFDVFQHRLLFAFTDQLGRIVGFSGRKLNDEDFGGKYVNTSDTSIFHKGSLIFNLHNARKAIAKNNEVYIVEGQFDVLAMKMSGIDNVVAVSGTSITEDHMKILNRAVGKDGVFIFCLDGDEAGLKAMRTTLEKHKIAQNKSLVVTFPENIDPCVIFEKKGSEYLKKYIEKKNKKASSEFIADMCVHGEDISTPVGKQKSLATFNDIAAKIGKGVFIDLCAQSLAKKLLTSKENILDSVEFVKVKEKRLVENSNENEKLFKLFRGDLDEETMEAFKAKYDKISAHSLGAVELRMFALILRFPGLVKKHGEPHFALLTVRNLYEISSKLPARKKVIVEEYGNKGVYMSMIFSDDKLLPLLHLMSPNQIEEHYEYLLKRKEDTQKLLEKKTNFRKNIQFLKENEDISVRELRSKIIMENIVFS